MSVEQISAVEGAVVTGPLANRVDFEANRLKDILVAQSTTNNPSVNHSLSTPEKALIEEKCFQAGQGIFFDGVTIEKGILTIYGCDNEDMVNAEIKSTIHSNFGNGVNIPCIKDVVVSHEWLKRNGMGTEYYKVPREVIVIWE